MGARFLRCQLTNGRTKEGAIAKHTSKKISKTDSHAEWFHCQQTIVCSLQDNLPISSHLSHCFLRLYFAPSASVGISLGIRYAVGTASFKLPVLPNSGWNFRCISHACLNAEGLQLPTGFFRKEQVFLKAQVYHSRKRSFRAHRQRFKIAESDREMHCRATDRFQANNSASGCSSSYLYKTGIKDEERQHVERVISCTGNSTDIL